MTAPEAVTLMEVLKALKAHPAVAWCERMNSKAARVGARFVRLQGCPDAKDSYAMAAYWALGSQSLDRKATTRTDCIPGAHPRRWRRGIG